jgi:hypothetical protein
MDTDNYKKSNSGLFIPEDFKITSTCSCGKEVPIESWEEIDGLQYIILEYKCPCGNILRKKETSHVFYVRRETDFLCSKCNSKIEVIEVFHPIMKNGVSSKTEKEFAPFCPKCETKPDHKGMAIKEL